MRTKGKKENFRVVIEPRSLTDFGGLVTSRGFLYPHTPEGQQRWEHDMEARCRFITADVKRHVDDIAHVSVEYDQDFVCSHCGSGWTEESEQYNGGCCVADEANNPEAATLAR